MKAELKEKLLKQLSDFINSFELVFHKDWEYSYDSLLDNQNSHYIISKTGTFLEPGVDISQCNWGNREGLLYIYNELVKTMIEANIYKSD